MPSNTDGWKPHIIRAAEEFYKALCSEHEEYGRVVEYHSEAFNGVFRQYNEYRERLHEILGGELMDRHKILAAYIFAFTEKDNLLFHINKDALFASPILEFPPWIMFPNEFFIYHLSISILTQFILATNKSFQYDLRKENYSVRLPDTVICWETNTQAPYSDHFIQLLFSMITHQDDIKHLLVASNLIFFFELAYDCVVANLSQIYYKLEGADNGKNC